MSDHQHSGDPYDDGKSAVTRFEGQNLARRNFSDVTHGDRALDTQPRGLWERTFGDPTRRAAEEARKRADHARAMGELADSKANTQISMERMLRSSQIGQTRADMEIAENQAAYVKAVAARERASTEARAAHELAELDLEIERRKRHLELARLEKQEAALNAPTVHAAPPRQPVEDHPVIAEMKAEYGTYKRIRIALRKARAELEEQKPLLTPEEYEERLTFLEYREAEVMSRIMAGEG